METVADELNTLDGQLGDGDLGITMLRGARGLASVKKDLPEDIGLALMRCAQAFTKVSASSYGTLMATGLMAAAKDSKGMTTRRWSDIAPLLHLAVEAMMKRGKGHLGAKTVLDTMHATAQELNGVETPAAALEAAKKAVAHTLDIYRSRPNELGRARIFAEKSIGMDDPGMVAFQRVLDAIG
jgi:phosphoenolpyruvate---glycerone phosphotransferase subunit DhaL